MAFFYTINHSVVGKVNIMRIIDLLPTHVRSELFGMSNGVKYHRNNKTSHRRFKERLTR